MKTSEPPFLTLARKRDLDEETAFTICRMIDSVGWELVEDWDWNWLEKKRKNYRSLVKHELLEGAWKLLFEKDWYSQQTTNDVDKRISTITPLEGLVNLRTLVLQNNLIENLGPVSGMVQLRDLNCISNQIRDLSPLRNLQSLEELALTKNPVKSFRVLETLPALRELRISNDQVPVFVECKRFSALRVLSVGGKGSIRNLEDFPEMPRLKVLSAENLKDPAGIERFGQLETLDLSSGSFVSIDLLGKLKNMTHLEITTSKPIDIEPLSKLSALRSLYIHCRKVQGLSSLSGLPVLHEVKMNDKTLHDANELEALRLDLTSWDTEFRAERAGNRPGMNLEVVDQKTFDHYDSKAPFGILHAEFNRGMFRSERTWLLREIRAALSVKFEEDVDFHLPYTSGFSRTERVIIYSVEAYEAFRDIVATIQTVLNETRNDWIIWCQSLLWESPEDQEIPEGIEDFIVWIYRDKVMVTEAHATAVRKLVEWGG
jgi:hypothetical protein